MGKLSDFIETRGVTENNFTCLLLALLSRAGVTTVLESDLKQKLVSYYKDPEYQELFQDITLVQGITKSEVNLTNGFYYAKYFFHGVWFDSFHSDILHPFPLDDETLQVLEQKLSFDGQEKMHQMVLELSKRYHMERMSSLPIRIYGVDSNGFYSLVSGNYGVHPVRFDLLTDGDITTINNPDVTGLEQVFHESPIHQNEAIQLENASLCDFRLENATFAVRQGFYDDHITYCEVKTKLLEDEILKKIVSLSNRSFDFNELSLTKDAPYIRKLKL